MSSRRAAPYLLHLHLTELRLLALSALLVVSPNRALQVEGQPVGDSLTTTLVAVPHCRQIQHSAHPDGYFGCMLIKVLTEMKIPNQIWVALVR
jgi:hypothetical protein